MMFRNNMLVALKVYSLMQILFPFKKATRLALKTIILSMESSHLVVIALIPRYWKRRRNIACPRVTSCARLMSWMVKRSSQDCDGIFNRKDGRKALKARTYNILVKEIKYTISHSDESTNFPTRSVFGLWRMDSWIFFLRFKHC